MVRWVLVCCLALLASVGVPLRAQSPAPAIAGLPTDPIKVFLDCDRCDHEHVRQNAGFVDHVLDRAVADVHVLVTTQNTGGGGQSWVVQFIGAGRFLGQDQTLRFDTASTATDDERRNAFLRVLKLGLASRAAGTRTAPELNVSWTKPAATGATQTRDPWNHWVFSMRVSGNANGERSSSSLSRDFGVSAGRTTDRWKIDLNANGDTQTSEFKIEGEPTIESRRHSWNTSGGAVKSVGPNWSVGARGSISHSSFSNLDRAISLADVVEFNVFPYSESSRRSLTFQYAAGIVGYKYTELTIYDRLDETIPRHALGARLNLKQPWGTLDLGARFSQHLPNPDRYNGSVSSQAEVRLFKGFSFYAYGEYERIKDQVSLRKSTASEQEVLLRIQQQATGYSYFVSFGFSYRFGSIFNNVVNTRINNSVF